MSQKFINLVVLIFGIAISLSFLNFAAAQTDETTIQTVTIINSEVVDPATDAISRLTFPIDELGDCTSQESCRAYCDIDENHDACINFAETHGLMSQREARLARLVENEGGPDGCRGRACRQYCENVDNLDTCLEFAEKRQLMSADELQEARKVQATLKRGVKLPEGCGNRADCKQICEQANDPKIARQCIHFAREAGLLPDGFDTDRAEQLFSLVESGEAPSFQDMRRCENPDLNTDSAVLEKCITIGHRLGMIKDEDVELAREVMLRGGPGECRGKEACRAYCENETHAEECYNFGKRHNRISPDQERRVNEGRDRFRRVVENAPQEVEQCIKNSLGEGRFNGLINSQVLPTPALAKIIEDCFTTFRTDSGSFPNGDRTPHLDRPGEVPFYIRNLPEEVRMCIEAEGNIDRFDVFFQNLGNNPTPQSFNDVVRLCMNRFGLPTTDADRAPQLDADRAPGIFPRDDQAPRQFPTDDIHPGLPVNDRATDEFKKQFEERFQEEFERQRRFQEEEIKRKLIEQQRQQNSATGNSQQGSGSTGNTGSGQNTQTLQQMIQKCVAAQGYWNGNNCELPPQKGNTPYEKCLKAGGVWMHASNECNLPTGSSQPHSRLNPPTFFGFFQQILIGN